jgi:hypothetical protein
MKSFVSSNGLVSVSPKSSGLRFIKAGAVGLIAAAGVSIGYGCSVCGCSLSSDWALQGYRDKPGLQVDARYEYYEQNDLRSGTHSVDTGSIALPAGDHKRLYLLTASSVGDQTASFVVGGKAVALSVQNWTGYVGQWDNRL